MSLRMAKAEEVRDGWYIKCPVCKTRIDLDRDPAPGGMEANIETCFECGADIEVHPPSDIKKQ